MAVSIITGGDTGTRESRDFYPTPKCSIDSLLDYLVVNYKFNGSTSILEPFAGNGQIVKILEDRGFEYLRAFDKYEYDAICSTPIETLDFKDLEFNGKLDWVITNPPYQRATLLPFVEKCIDMVNNGVAMFLKGTFLETINRKEFFENNRMLKEVLVFANRQPMYKNGNYIKGNSNAIMYCWFIWDKTYSGYPVIKWLDNSRECKENRQNNVY